MAVVASCPECDTEGRCRFCVSWQELAGASRASHSPEAFLICSKDVVQNQVARDPWGFSAALCIVPARADCPVRLTASPTWSLRSLPLPQVQLRASRQDVGRHCAFEMRYRNHTTVNTTMSPGKMVILNPSDLPV